ncbi:MAG TPA: phosphomannomutase/phosphoglucomutase [Candidatus Eisenbacteria bacterium]|jgi:phosphomannomutase/phosphoglucomutase|nr:phosphomannomutase/phosphoglucomutase [Candidatus Eisenbacteria bacterium]
MADIVNPQIFREYDIRGLHERDLTDGAVTLIGKAFGTYLRRRGKKTIAVGRDFRLSSPRILKAVTEGLVSTGMEVALVGEVPTPGLYYSIVATGSDAGLQVTGSHNPIEYNGLKLCEGVQAVWGEAIQSLLGLIRKGDFEKGTGSVHDDPTGQRYRDMLAKKVKPVAKMKVVLDAGNGSAGPFAPGIFKQLGQDVVALFCEPDGSYPNHTPDPTVEANLQDLIRTVRAEKADFGIGYDGDADRIGAVDGQGRILWGDQLLALFARDVLAEVPGAPIVFDVKCSQGLEEDIVAHGGKPVMWKTGHSIMKAKIKELNAPLGGELSGHIFFTHGYYGFDDAIYGSLKLLEIVTRSGKTLGELRDSIPYYTATPEIRLDTTDDEKFAIVARVRDHFAKQYPVIDIDGARVQFPDGWALVRASNTQPVLVVRFEARSRERLEQIQDAVYSVLEREGVSATPAGH